MVTAQKLNFGSSVATNIYCRFFAGKGENIWDRYTHTNPKFVEKKENGDVACDSYHLYEKDVELLKDIGVCKIPMFGDFSRKIVVIAFVVVLFAVRHVSFLY